jgi:hypothetical protein
MNIQPTPITASGITASIAGTSRAAAHGGEHEKQVIEATRQRSTAEKPAGKAGDSSAVDAGDATGDRGGDGRQTYDYFEKRKESDEESSANQPHQENVNNGSNSNPKDLANLEDQSRPHLDFRA